ncbi:hypothetical protein [uncultured Corynebacterium sp.]|uniref:hypothetical protein n=1 Tax=uncultured Corynebacterium sp. TaxID=159447 RepID=UPI0025CE427C|nr:hypothetical protein [uncultured Corynebacterium sp.]
MTTPDFTAPVELRSIVSSGDRLRRAAPLMAVTFVVAFIATAAVVTFLLDTLWLGCVLGAVLGVILCRVFFGNLQTASDRSNQRVTLSADGIRATDGTLTTLMRWGDVRMITTPRGANRVGIVGDAMLTLNAKGDPKLVERYSEMTETPESFRSGRPVHDHDGALFPGDFEKDWRQGEIGSWLRHYRPDLDV